MILLLVLYTSLPVLLTALSIGNTGTAFYGGLGLFLLQTTAEVLIFRSRNRRRLIPGAVLFFTILAGAVTVAAMRLDPSYLLLLLDLYPGPLLTVSYVIIYKISRPRDFGKISPGFNRIIILLISYAALLLMLRFRRIITATPAPSVRDIFFAFYGAVNLLPPIYFLRTLRDSSLTRIYRKEGRIWLRNEEITSLFSRTELSLLNRAFKGDGRILCRDLVEDLNGGESPGKYLCRPGECKASLCPAYAAIYRHIKSLDRKMENLGLGMLMPPENKRDIITEGWLFIRNKEVRIMRKRSFPLKIPAAYSPENKTEKSKFSAALPLLLAIAFTGAFALCSEGLSLAGLLPAPQLLFPLTLTTACCLLCPLMGQPKWSRFIPTLILPLLSLSLIGPAGEAQALFLSLKSIVLFIICFLIRFPALETQLDSALLKEQAPNALFWLIWFYMILLSLFIDPLFTDASLLRNSEALPPSPPVSERLLLFLLFALSAGFFSLSRKALIVKQEKIEFNGRVLPEGLGKTDRIIFREFIQRRRRPLHCYEILELISPGKKANSGDDCKPSSCPSYQKIYKRIQTIRKYLQTTGIGTIASPERKVSSHKEGWRLILFDDVFIKND